MYYNAEDQSKGDAQSVDAQNPSNSVIATDKSILTRFPLPAYEGYNQNWRTGKYERMDFSHWEAIKQFRTIPNSEPRNDDAVILFVDPEMSRHYWAASFFLPIGSIFVLGMVVLLMVTITSFSLRRDSHVQSKRVIIQTDKFLGIVQTVPTHGGRDCRCDSYYHYRTGNRDIAQSRADLHLTSFSERERLFCRVDFIIIFFFISRRLRYGELRELRTDNDT